MSDDISRDSFDPRRGYSGVRIQQGRVSVDADYNEGAAIQLHLARTLAADLIGPHGGSAGAFALTGDAARPFDMRIGSGRYYAHGWTAQNDGPRWWTDQGLGAAPTAGRWLAWLEVWDRVVRAAEVDAALPAASPWRLADPALGGQESAARLETVWAVRLEPVPPDGEASWAALAPRLAPNPALGERGRLAVQGGYTGLDNRLYRIQIHQGASFLWSRQNASTAVVVRAIAGKTLTLEGDASEFRAGAWATLETRPGLGLGPPPLVQLASAGTADGRLTLRTAPPAGATVPAVLRLWDQTPAARLGRAPASGAMAIVTGRTIALEDGLSLTFTAPDRGGGWRAGDYWLVPARPAVGAALWPPEGAIGPHGVERRAAPLGVVGFDANGRFSLETDLRRTLRPLAD